MAILASQTLSGQNSLKKARSNSFSWRCFSRSCIFCILLESALVFFEDFCSWIHSNQQIGIHCSKGKEQKHSEPWKHESTMLLWSTAYLIIWYFSILKIFIITHLALIWKIIICIYTKPTSLNPKFI